MHALDRETVEQFTRLASGNLTESQFTKVIMQCAKAYTAKADELKSAVPEDTKADLQIVLTGYSKSIDGDNSVM